MSFDKMAGIYVYCMDHHTGQWSRLYRLMSRIKSSLRDSHIQAIKYGKFDKGDEWLEARQVYRQLKRRQAQ